MVELITIWHGTEDEAYAFQIVLAHNCGCTYDEKSGAKTHVCAAHDAMVHNQRFLDGLLFERHIASQLEAEEGL